MGFFQGLFLFLILFFLVSAPLILIYQELDDLNKNISITALQVENFTDNLNLTKLALINKKQMDYIKALVLLSDKDANE